MRWQKRDYPSRLGAGRSGKYSGRRLCHYGKLIEEQGCPQAFIASSLPVLEGAVRAIRDRLGAVPPEINIGTFDEHPMLGFLANNVWSMQQDENAWAEKAFEMMLSAIEERPVKKTFKVEMKLIKRIRKK